MGPGGGEGVDEKIFSPVGRTPTTQIWVFLTFEFYEPVPEPGLLVVLLNLLLCFLQLTVNTLTSKLDQ